MSEQRVRGGATIPCPNCQGRTRVLQTRRQPDKTVWRERNCLSCDTIFDTNEKPISLTPDKKAQGDQPWAHTYQQIDGSIT